jgi:probable phosphoglycerate mutase
MAAPPLRPLSPEPLRSGWPRGRCVLFFASVTTTRFILIRHAESTWNATGRWQGHGDPPLSGRGREQAGACATELAGEAVDRLVCSDLQRARETAECIAGALDLSPQPDSELRELDVGDWTGLTRDEIEMHAPELLEDFESGDPDVRPGGGESRREIRARTRGVAQRLAEAYPGQRIALVVHLGVIRALVPGAEPANTERLEVTLDQILEARDEDGAPRRSAL